MTREYQTPPFDVNCDSNSEKGRIAGIKYFEKLQPLSANMLLRRLMVRRLPPYEGV
jgi:hypothetical protein